MAHIALHIHKHGGFLRSHSVVVRVVSAAAAAESMSEVDLPLILMLVSTNTLQASLLMSPLHCAAKTIDAAIVMPSPLPLGSRSSSEHNGANNAEICSGTSVHPAQNPSAMSLVTRAPVRLHILSISTFKRL